MEIGPWIVESPIGSGASGHVYRAHRRDDQASIAAVKLLASSEAVTPELIRRFEREVEALRRIDHPAIARLLDHGTSPLYIAMELVSGRSLRAILNEKRTVEAQSAIRIGHHLAGGLAVIHAHGVTHRDIKPDNVMLTGSSPGFSAKLVDFGIALLGNEVPGSQHGAFIGTVDYSAPEAFGLHAKLPDPAKLDVYSLGVVLYEMLTGETPYARRFSREMPGRFDKVLEEKLTAAACDVGAIVPPELRALLSRMTAKVPADRPSAAEVGRELERLGGIEGNGVQAPQRLAGVGGAAERAMSPHLTDIFKGMGIGIALIAITTYWDKGGCLPSPWVCKIPDVVQTRYPECCDADADKYGTLWPAKDAPAANWEAVCAADAIDVPPSVLSDYPLCGLNTGHLLALVPTVADASLWEQFCLAGEMGVPAAVHAEFPSCGQEWRRVEDVAKNRNDQRRGPPDATGRRGLSAAGWQEWCEIIVATAAAR